MAIGSSTFTERGMMASLNRSEREALRAEYERALR